MYLEPGHFSMPVWELCIWRLFTIQLKKANKFTALRHLNGGFTGSVLTWAEYIIRALKMLPPESPLNYCFNT